MKVTHYLIQELNKLGIEEFFGLPGDYNFNILYAIEKNKNTCWIGCTNELNAGYAADGYARLRGCGAVVTTFGVGELSAINAVAGSCAENVPVIKIVGTPSSEKIKNNVLMHHNLNKPNYYAFKNAYSNVVETTAFLDENNAKDEIDRVLSVFVNTKKPVYIAIPEDICNIEIENKPNIKIARSNEENLKKAVEKAAELIKKSKEPVIIADGLVKRLMAEDEMNSFVVKSSIPTTTFIMGKGLIDDDYPFSLGLYCGKYANKETYKYVNSSDCIIAIGATVSDLNTYGFDIKFNVNDYINIQGNYTVIENQKYENVLMKDILKNLTKKIEKKQLPTPEKNFLYKTKEIKKVEPLGSEYFYSRLQDFLEPDDILITETGIVRFGVPLLKLPKNTRFEDQTLWGSIGWATPAGLGASLACKNSRVIIVTGEGSHQLTAQEISTVMRNNLKPIFIVMNNDGYTIERLLSHSPKDEFNCIAQWNYSKLPDVFEGECFVKSVTTNKEFDEALKEAQVEQKSKMCYIETTTQMLDLPYLCEKIFYKDIALFKSAL